MAWNAGNLGFRVITINIGDPVMANVNVCVLAVTRWSANLGNNNVWSTVGAVEQDFGSGSAGPWKDIIPGLTNEILLRGNLQFGQMVYGLIMGGYDVEMQWLPPTFKFEINGAFTPLDKWSFLVAYEKNGRG